MRITNNTPFEIEALPMKGPEDKSFLAVIVKGTFDLVHKGTATISEEQLFPTGDELYSDDDEGDGSHFYGSDFAYNHLIKNRAGGIVGEDGLNIAKRDDFTKRWMH